MRSPVHRPIAFSKFFVEPRFWMLRISRTGNGAVRANSSMISAVPSDEPSSQMTSSSGRRLCAAMLASCSGRKRLPLYVHIATEMHEDWELADITFWLALVGRIGQCPQETSQLALGNSTTETEPQSDLEGSH